jgi:phage terminase large subunit
MITPVTQSQPFLMREQARKNPDWWVEQIFQCTLWRLQKEIIQAVAGHPRTTVRSCTGSGKTYLAAHIVLWFLANYMPGQVLTTAPTFRQVESVLWKEIASAYIKTKFEKGFGGSLKATRLDMKEDWFALGLSTDEPERFQGFHSPNMLVVGDEASGLDEKVYTAIETPLSTGFARLLLIGNPTQPVGRFRDTFDSPLYQHFHISAFDTPNFAVFGITLEDIKSGAWKDKMAVAQWQIEDGTWMAKLPCPYLINPLWVAERLAEWGEGSFQFQTYVLGEFPAKGAHNLFNLTDVEAAIDRKVNDEGDIVSALDVARYGECESVYGKRRGERVFPLQTWGHEGIHYTTGRTARHLREDNASGIYIDAGGIGADDCDILKGEGFNVTRVLSNEPAIDKERFLNRRAELYWMLSKRFADGKISIPKDRKLVSQLCDIRYDYKNGRIFIESKEAMIARGSKSPDRADMLAMLFHPGDAFADDAPEPWVF